MDFGEIIGSAWRLTWRHKRLWWLGLFAGGVGGANYSSYQYNLNEPTSYPGAFTPPPWTDSAYPWIFLVLAVLAVLFLIWIVFLVFQVAARGGLISQIEIAEQGAEPSASAGWRQGFARWWRLAGVQAVALLPVLVLGALFAIGVIVFVAGLIGDETFTPGLILGIIGVSLTLLLLALPVIVVLGVLVELAQRHIMLEDAGIGAAFSRAWWLVRHRLKDVALLWLVSVGLGLGFGLALGVAMLVIAVPTALLFVVLGIGEAGAGSWWPLVALGLVIGIPVLIGLAAASAGFATFHSALWTLAWRRLTGRVAPPSATLYGTPGFPTSTGRPGSTAPAAVPSPYRPPPAPPPPPVPPAPPPPAAPLSRP